MLQRIQTVFLLLVVLFMLLMMIFPVWIYVSEDSGSSYMLTAFYLELQEGSQEATRTFFPYMLIATFAIASVTVGIIEISKFKNRLLQMKLGALNSLLMIGSMGMGLWLSNGIVDEKHLEHGWSYGIGAFLPAGAMICNVIANRFIRKDERLVRSVDRIR